MTVIGIKTSQSVKPLPGDIAMWIFIGAELSVFALLFLLFSALRSTTPDIYIQGQQSLHPIAGLVNTLALITASWFAAIAVETNRSGHYKNAAIWIQLSIATAGIYVFVKTWEYWMLIEQGYDLDTNVFYTGYFLITGFHLLHVVLGIFILFFMSFRLFSNTYTENNDAGFISGICYWHMVDLVWVILFPLIYVIR